MIHVVMPVGMLQCNCSVLGDEQTREAIVVDPGDEVERIMAVLRQHGLTVKAIVITHGHIDHISGAQQLKVLTGAPVYMNSRDQEQVDSLEQYAAWLGVPTPEAVEMDIPAKDGDTLRLNGRDLHILETPGHTQGSVCLYIPAEHKLLAGDTLFQGSIGRTDLPGGNTRQLLSSIKSKLLVLPEETLVTPGHGDNTTIGEEIEHNPFLEKL
jgi:hydroxyacylglutathione hydrolase